MSSTQSGILFISKKKYDSIEECNCGGPVFKYHNVSKNVFMVQCGYHKKVLDIDKTTKKKVWIVPKKVSCGWKCMYNGERPVFEEINKNLITYVDIKKQKNIHEKLEDKLRILFNFLFISNHSSTLDEINILVKNNLLREPRKTFYYPSIGHYMRVSHFESFDEYQERIFSKKIVDLSHLALPKIQPVCKIVFIDSPILHRETVTPPPTPSPKVVKCKPKKKIELSSQFIVVSDEENSDTEESEGSDNNSESGESVDVDREQSDFESVFGDENYDENGDISDAPDYYDDE